MKRLILIYFCLIFTSAGFSQSAHVSAEKIWIAEDGNLSVRIQKDGQYFFSYQNGMSGNKDERNIVFKNKQDIRAFEKRIEKALSSKDGSSDLVIYKAYKIRLLTEIGGIFMIVNEPGQTQSTLRISNEMYQQVNRL